MMNAARPDEFGMGKLDDLTWAAIEGYAGEVSRDDGEVTYRGEFLCVAYNDADGGDIEDDDGTPMTDEQVQARIREIDWALRTVNCEDYLELVDPEGYRTGRIWTWNPAQTDADAPDSWMTALEDATDAADELGEGAKIYRYENSAYQETEYVARPL